MDFFEEKDTEDVATSLYNQYAEFVASYFGATVTVKDELDSLQQRFWLHQLTLVSLTGQLPALNAFLHSAEIFLKQHVQDKTLVAETFDQLETLPTNLCRLRNLRN